MDVYGGDVVLGRYMGHVVESGNIFDEDGDFLPIILDS